MFHFWLAMTPSLPLQGAHATPIASSFSWAVIGDQAWYFSNLEPFDCHAAHDTRAQALRIARFFTVAGVRCVDLARAFDVSRPTVYRAAKLLETKGETAFGAPQRPRRRTVISPAMARRAETMLASGTSGRACARALGVSHSTFNENLRSGIIKAPIKEPVAEDAMASERSQRSKEARRPAIARACHDVEGRLLASTGMMEEASPRFDTKALAVERGGVLAGPADAAAGGSPRDGAPRLASACGVLWSFDHPHHAGLHDHGPGAHAGEAALPGARGMGSSAGSRPMPGGQDPQGGRWQPLPLLPRRWKHGNGSSGGHGSRTARRTG